MEILFVWTGPCNYVFSEDSSNKTLYHKLRPMISSSFLKPQTFPILAALTPKEHTIEIVEGGHEAINYNKEYDLVAITCTTAYAFLAYDIADEFRKRGVTVVLGGWHPSALPEEAKQHADSVVVGEAEETWPQLLHDLGNGKLKAFYELKRPVDPKLIPHPYNIYPRGTQLAIHASRGCPNRCEFCAITNMKFRHIYRVRDIQDVIKDIISNSGKNFAFYDDSLTINPRYTKQLFKEIKGLNKKFIAYGNIDVLGKDEELLKLAREAGCICWMVGFESISQESLKSVGKKTNTVKKYAENVKKIHDRGMSVLGFFVFGFDYDKLDVFEKTDEMVSECDIDTPKPIILTPLPGTPLYNRIEKEGRILSKDWSKYDFRHVVFQPRHMSPEELYFNTIDLHKRWFKTSNIVKRLIKSVVLGFHPFSLTMMNNIRIKYSMYQD